MYPIIKNLHFMSYCSTLLIKKKQVMQPSIKRLELIADIFQKYAQTQSIKLEKKLPLHSVWRLNSPDRKSTRLNSSHVAISYAVFCLKKKTETGREATDTGRPWAQETSQSRGR